MLPVYHPVAMQVESCSLLAAVTLLWMGKCCVLEDSLEDSVLLTWQTQFGAPHLHFVILREDSLFPSSAFYKLNHNVL